MAGIGFELRKLLRKDNYLGVLQAYSYAGLISAGPWVISILGILVLGLISLAVVENTVHISQFQTSVTYLISTSLVFSGLFQLGFTRYVADELFREKTENVIPNFNGLMLMYTCIMGLISYPLSFYLFSEQTLLYRLLMPSTFILLCNIWLATTLLSGLKQYKSVLIVFALGYGTTIITGFLLRHFSLDGLLFSFFLGHFVLLSGILFAIDAHYATNKLIDFDFLFSKKVYRSLIFAGFLFNLGIWIDKYVFWFMPQTGQRVIGPLHSSIIYDLPIFLAYLAIIPGMAVFLVRMETDFVEYYHKFYDAIRDGGTLSQIRDMHSEMVMTAKQGIFEIIKIQTLTVLFVFIAGPALLRLLHISPLFLSLFYVDVVAVSLQVVMLGLLNVFFYLDKRYKTVILTLLFFILNLVFSIVSIKLGTAYYGYGFASALLVCVCVGMWLLDKDFEELPYVTFMLQKSL